MSYESKYEALKDKEWLIQKYVKEGLQIPEVAKEANAPRGSVRNALVSHGIELRVHVPKTILPPEANDKNWLQKKYWEEGLSLTEIAEVLGLPNPKRNFSAVRYALIRNGIKVRSKGEGHIYLRQDEGFVFCKDVIEGCLLGDGCLKIENKASSDSRAAFCKKNIFQDHVELVARLMIPEKWKERIRTAPNKHCYFQGKEYISKHDFIHYFQTLTHDELTSLYREWYPASNGYKKLIPESIEITPATLLHWFLDDGSAFERKYYYNDLGRHEYKRRQIALTFACQSFKEENLWMLCEKIKAKFGLKMTPTFHQRHGLFGGTGMEVVVATTHAHLFYEIIGAPPISSLSYKWKCYLEEG